MPKFNQPQLQSPIGVLVMFFDTMRHYARAVWPFILLWIFKFDEINKTYFLLGLCGILFLTGIIAYFKYRNFTFYIDSANDEFIINEGIFNKTKTVVQLNKIQQVNINQSLIQRLIGVYAVDIDTAGSKKKEGEIRAISHPLALELKARLLDNENTKAIIIDEAEPSSTAEDHPFIEISFLSLLKVGITSNYIRSFGLLLAFFITLYDLGMNLIENAKIDQNKFDNYFSNYLLIESVAIIIILLLVGILVINLVRIMIKFFNYKIIRQKGSLLISYGLLNTKSTIIKPEKVQITTVSQNYFQKKLNILELKIKQASSGEKEERRSAIEIPGCDKLESNEILKLLFQKLPQKGFMLKPNYRKFVFSVFLTIVLPIAGFYLFAYNIEPKLLEYTFIIPIYTIFRALLIHYGFKNYRLFINNDFIIKQSGAWDVDNEIIEPFKIQALTTSQLFWHKSADIGYLTIHTAGGSITFQLGNYSTIKQYVNLWLYEMETSDSNWM